jgi:hypothetical protein
MFSDPQTVTINAIAQTLARVGSGIDTGKFRKDDTTVELLYSHNYGKRARRLVRLDHRKTAVDPLIPAQNAPYNMSTWLVADVPLVGYSLAEQKQVVDGFAAYLTASSGANITKLLAGES